MSYNYSRAWLDGQADLLNDLVSLAREHGVSSIEFSDYNEADAFRFRVRNVLASLAVHYPAYADICRALRTWKEIDHLTSVMRIYVGTENNYKANRTSRRPSAVPIRLRGSRPTGPINQSSYGMQAPPPASSPVLETKEPGVYEHDELIEPGDLIEGLHVLGRHCATAHVARVILVNQLLDESLFKAALDEEIVAREFKLIDHLLNPDGQVVRIELNFQGDYV